MMDGEPNTPTADDFTPRQFTNWHATTTVPVRLFGLPRQRVHLTVPVSDDVITTATQEFTNFHDLQCHTCSVLKPLHRVLHPIPMRAALIIATCAVILISAAIAGPVPIAQLPLSAIIAVVLVHTAWTLGTFAAFIHRRRMPSEMELRVHRTRLHMGQPHS